MEDNTSTELVYNDTQASNDVQPAEDLILNTLSDDDSQSDDSTDSSNADETQNEDDTEAETKSQSDDESEVEQPKEEDNEDQVIDPKEEARRRYEERQAFRAEQRAKIAKETETYTAEAQDEYDQRLRAMEVQRYQELIENTQDKLVSEFERAKVNPDLQMFNPDSKEFNQKIYDKAMRDFNSGYITYDSNGNMVGLKSSLYEHLTETAELYSGAVKSGQFKQVRDSKQMQSKADVKPAASPKEITKDPILDILKSD